MHLPTPDTAQVLLTLTSVVAIWFGWVKVVGPMLRAIWSWVTDLFAVFRGRPARIDRLTGERLPEVPSLVDALVQIRDTQTEQGKSIDNLTTVVTQVANQQVTLDEHTKQIADLRLATGINAEQVGLLKKAADERTAMHQETTALLGMVASKDDIVGEADEK